MHVADYVWYITVGVLLALLAVDVFIIGRRPHEPTMRESRDRDRVLHRRWRCSSASASGASPAAKYAGEFFAGWLTEYSLSRSTTCSSS